MLATLTYILHVHRYHCTIPGLRHAEELGEEKEAEFEFVRACKLMPKENFYLLVAVCWNMLRCGTLVVLNSTLVIADYILIFHMMFDAKACSEIYRKCIWVIWSQNALTHTSLMNL